MKLSENKKKAVSSCLKDLAEYYQTCGKDFDFKNLEILKEHLNSIQSSVEKIDALAKFFEPINSKK